jgi:modification methylase
MATATVLTPALEDFVPNSLRNLADPQTALPRIARDPSLTAEIEEKLANIPTSHDLHHADARHHTAEIEPESVHLVLTSPPYWTLKEYRHSDGQLGYVADYGAFIHELEKVWKHCWKALAPGGRLVIVVGDVCLSRRQNDGRHTVVPLHASITESCRKLGFDNLAPIFWYKISNAAYEVENGSRFLGKPYEPNGVIKNDVEYILMQRKPGAYRKPTLAARILSVISAANHQKYFQQIWSDVTGASTKDHPAPYPLELADRLVRMFSFVGDTVLDPFLGTGTTSLAAAKCGRNSRGIEIDPHYLEMAAKRLITETTQLWGAAQINVHRTAADTGRKPGR